MVYCPRHEKVSKKWSRLGTTHSLSPPPSPSSPTPLPSILTPPSGLPSVLLFLAFFAGKGAVVLVPCWLIIYLNVNTTSSPKGKKLSFGDTAPPPPPPFPLLPLDMITHFLSRASEPGAAWSGGDLFCKKPVSARGFG